MPGNPYTSNEEQFEYFMEAMTSAFENIAIPSGVIDGDNIIDGTIRPNKCALGAKWNFRGGVSAPNIRGGGGAQPNREMNPFRMKSTRIFADYVLGDAPIVLADATRKVINITLPPAAAQTSRLYIVKRLDDIANSSVRLNTVGNDKIDAETLISLPERGSLVFFSSGLGWHIIANYS
tara:strand:+ start:217 stop:750 length:534 start_codon:yes stop_codon:yes gene_type:complete